MFLLLALVLLFTPPAAQVTSNPPCNFQPGDFATPPAPRCDNPTPNYWLCVGQCAEDYKGNRARTANRWCERVAELEDQRRQELAACTATYNQCIANGGSEGFCSTERNDCNRLVNTTYDFLVGRAGRDRDAEDADSVAAFNECAKACCAGGH